MNSGAYCLLTAARNEVHYIEKTIQAVISQTVQPIQWTIVSDGSVDGTDDIILSYTNRCHFINYVRRDSQNYRHFGSKVYALNAGYCELEKQDYDFLGFLDADVSFDQDYYERVLERFSQNGKLGIAGGLVIDICDGKLLRRFSNTESVNGAVQLFRRQCYEDVGGYVPLKCGGIDAVAEVMARMKGWQTKVFPDIQAFHHRRMGTQGRSVYKTRFLQGKEDYLLGYHPIFEIVKCFSRITMKPYVLGSVLWFSGYLSSCLRKEERAVSPEFVRYLRAEQLHRLISASG